MIRLALVDDHNLVRESLAQIIDSMPGISVVFQAGNGCEFLKKLRDTYIDMVLLDLQMPVLDGFATCDILHKEYPDMKIMAISQHSEPKKIRKILHLGAHGYATKKMDIDSLERAIFKLHNQGFFFEDNLQPIVDFIRNNPDSEGLGDSKIISEREIEIIRLSALDFTSKEIAEQLHISIRTIDAHKRNLMHKLNTKSFISVLVAVLSRGLIDVADLKRK